MASCVKLTEEEILSRINAGDRSAEKHLYFQYAGYLTGVCARYVNEPENVRDILHDGFLKILAAISSFEYRGEGSLKGWMTRILVNEALKFLKSANRLELTPLTGEDEQIADDDTDIDGIPSAALHDMIRQLPVGYRTVLNLYVFEEKSHREIAGILNIKESTSASQFHRAKLLLAEKIRQYQHSNVSTIV